MVCTESGRFYYTKDVIDQEQGVRIEKFEPLDGICDDSGSTNFEKTLKTEADKEAFFKAIEDYKATSPQLLEMYNTFGNLVDFEPRKGYEDYDKLKRQIAYNLKH